MEELLRIEKCLETLQDAPCAPVQPLNYSEFLTRLQELKKDVKDQLNRVKAFNFKARQLKESMRQEIPNILKLCYENPANDLVGERCRIEPDANPGTPVMLTPRPPRKRVIINTGIGITTPRRNTPLSLSKSLLQHKFSARGSPSTFSKLQFRGTPVGSIKRASLECTPQMPSATSKRKQVRMMSPVSTVSKGKCEVKVTKLPASNASELKVRETTPEMKERVSFFSNPNVANIHKRYVAIQDQDADESTCLLSARFGPKTSRTPEFPMSSQKKPQMQTPAQRGEVTPPLPVSSAKKALHSSSTPPSKPKVYSESDFDRTPSPPKSVRSTVRRCLETKTANSGKLTEKFDDLRLADLKGTEHRPEIPRKHESQAPTEPLTKISISINQTPASRTLFATPSLKGTSQNRTLGAKTIGDAKTSTLQHSVLRDNLNSLRKKRLLTNLEKTPIIPKIGKLKATPKPRMPTARSSTMPLDAENTTLALRPSKMLRNKTIAP